jgi:hypothetical protein
MTSDQMAQDEMDEPHPYMGRFDPKNPFTEKTFYPVGNLDYKPAILQRIQGSGSAQLVNEYGWVWLWRNGIPSKLTVDVYNYYVGKNSTPEQNREFQAYWMQLETEWLRSEPSIAGVLAFCVLTNNYGYTGDWYTGNIKDLKPSPTMEWFRHAFAPAAVFINLTDERYTKFIRPHLPGSILLFNLAGINNYSTPVEGKVKIRLINKEGKSTTAQEISVKLESFLRKDIPVMISLPNEAGGYVLVAEFTPKNGTPVISRRFINVGNASSYSYYDLKL